MDELQVSYRQFRPAEPLLRQPWLEALNEAVTDPAPAWPTSHLGYQSSSHGPQPAAGAETQARRALIVVNGLWEWGGRSLSGLLGLSHIRLLASFVEALASCGVASTLVDFRHAPRVGVFLQPTETHPWAQRPGVPPDWTADVLSVEARDGYLAAFQTLVPSSCPSVDAHVIEPARDTPVVDLVAAAGHYLESVVLDPHDLVCVAGGIFYPYLVESLLARMPGRKFFYCFSFRNGTLAPSLYEGVLTPVPHRRAMPSLKHYLRPSGIPGLPPRTPKPDEPHANGAGELDEEPAVVAIGRNVGRQINDEYVEMLGRLAARLGPVRLVVVGKRGVIAPRLLEVLESQRVRLEEVGEVLDIPAELSRFRGHRAVVVNPRFHANGASIIYATYAGLPPALFVGSDAESVLPKSCFFESVSDLERRVAALLESEQERSAALAEIDEAREQFERDVKNVIRFLVYEG